MSRAPYAVVHHVIRKISLNVEVIKRKNIISKFADKIGVVYFGSVDQHRDDHKIVRGFTVSASHHDNHFCVGSVDGYDMSIVDRSDTAWQSDGSIIINNWIIMAFDLHTKVEIPHFFLEAKNRDAKSYNSLFTSFPLLTPIRMGTFENYDPEFTNRFSLYTKPLTSIEVEHLFPAMSARVISAHFWPFSAEQLNNVLYIYASDMKITPALLDVMFQNGLWLAENLDAQAEIVW